jgi:hypothetical protein
MTQLGRGAKATAVQRAEVERLAAEGMSVRRIAEAVFGDPRFRGRVERILRRRSEVNPQANASPTDPALEGIDVSELEPTAAIRLLFQRRLAFWMASEEAPSMSELRNLLDVERRLEAAEAVARARARREHENGSQ